MVSDIALIGRFNMFQLIMYLLFFFSIIITVHCVINNFHLKSEINQLEKELDIIIHENLRHRILVKPYSHTQNLCFQINELCALYQNDILSFKKSEKKYKNLMVNLSHDVRTPLASMIGHLELLTDSLNNVSLDKYASLEVINRKALELTNFIEMLFQWTKLDANEEKLTLSTFDITEQSRIIISKWITAFEKNNIEYSFSIPEKKYLCILDATAYQRILDNIFKNILNHSHATKLHFSITQSATYVSISIEDNGIGIDTKEQSFIFERLYRCDISQNNKGNGLGLSIAKELTEKMQGTISVESIPNTYTKFLISFPLQN